MKEKSVKWEREREPKQNHNTNCMKFLLYIYFFKWIVVFRNCKKYMSDWLILLNQSGQYNYYKILTINIIFQYTSEAGNWFNHEYKTLVIYSNSLDRFVLLNAPSSSEC